jgi:hypothetical protein
MFGAEFILDKLIILIFLFFGEDPRWAFGFSFLKIRVVNILSAVLADLKPEVSSFLSRYRLKKIVLVDRVGLLSCR